MRETKLIRAEEDSPTRCQAVTATGQCPYEGHILDSGTQLKYCAMHHGQAANQEQVKSLRNYRLTKFKAQIEDKANSDSIKSLREEIGITRQVLETFINRCEDETDLLIHSNKISDLVLKIEKLVSSCHRLERSTGQLLDKTAIIQVAAMFTEIISEYVDDNAQSEISNRLVDVIKNIEVIESAD